MHPTSMTWVTPAFASRARGRQDVRMVSYVSHLTVDAADDLPAMTYVHQVSHIDGVREALAKLDLPGSPAGVASGVEFILEGLHLNRRLNKDRSDGAGARYKS